MNSAISINNLSKDYGDIHALQDISLDIPLGQITGLVGPNGAGKTTLIKSLVGALTLTGGQVKVLNLDPISKRWDLRKKIGYMPQESALYMDLSARENVTFFARLHRIKNPREHAERILSELDLGKRQSSPVHTLSGGMQKRVSLACALVHDPELLILDEPTAALDPLLKRQLWERFRQLAREGKTLIITTHLMEEALLCDSVILLQHGQVVANDNPHKLIATGEAILSFSGQDKEWTEKIQAEGSAIASTLHKYGLSKDISRLEIKANNLEDIMVEILNKKEKKG